MIKIINHQRAQIKGSSLENMNKRVQWLPEEDLIILQRVLKFDDVISWQYLASFLNRSAKQVRERYVNCLNPLLEERLTDKVRVGNRRWSELKNEVMKEESKTDYKKQKWFVSHLSFDLTFNLVETQSKGKATSREAEGCLIKRSQQRYRAWRTRRLDHCLDEEKWPQVWSDCFCTPESFGILS